MARKKFKTLTEQMFYTLLCLQVECCGMDIMGKVSEITGGRISIGPGTLYTLLSDFEKTGIIRETAVEGRKRSYIITQDGIEMLEDEYQRMRKQIGDYKVYFEGDGKGEE